MRWLKLLRHDPIAPLMAVDISAIMYHVRRDLLEERVPPVRRLWESPEVQRILRRQNPDGSFEYPGKRVVPYPAHHYPLVETWKQIRFLVEQYGTNRRHEPTRRAAEYLFSCQTEDGDIRGFIGNQYATYYTGAILGLLIKAGYAGDPRIKSGMQWLLGMRQDDGGWTVPMITVKLSRAQQYRLTTTAAPPIEPDRAKPFSHNWTGMVLRAFAAHSRYCKLKSTRIAAGLLKGRFFKPDGYTSYKSAHYWTTFAYPFWWNNLVAAMDTLSTIGLSADDRDMQRGLDWFVAHQQKDGLWSLDHRTAGQSAAPPAKATQMRAWVALAICRILRRCCG